MSRSYISLFNPHPKNRFAASILWLSAFACCSLGAGPSELALELKGAPGELAMVLTNVPRDAQITGESELKVQADRAVLTVKVSTTARELGAALRSNQEARNKLADQLARHGIPGDAIKASKFSSTEKYGVFTEKVKSHRVNNLLKVTVRNEKEFQTVADVIDSLPEAQYLGAEFERSDKEEMKAKAIAAACENANRRKEVFEEKLGVKLNVRRFLDPSAVVAPTGAPPVTAGSRAYGFDWYLGNTPSGSADYSDSIGTRAAEQREGDESGFGELTFRSRVTVEYTVEGK